MQRFAHERHPWLVALPIAAVLFTLVADFVFVFSGNEGWWLVGRPVLTIGLVGLIAAIGVGFLDLHNERERATRDVASAYLGLDLVALIALGTETWLRWTMPVPTDATPGVAWSVLCAILLTGSAFLGRNLVQLHHEPTSRL